MYFYSENIDLEHQVKDLIQIDHFKDLLISTVTHDLRSPLNSIIHNIEKVKEAKLEPVREKNLTFAKLNADLLLGLISDIIDYSLIKEEKLRLNLESFKLSETLNHVY